jgi:hypothetical protein
MIMDLSVNTLILLALAVTIDNYIKTRQRNTVLQPHLKAALANVTTKLLKELAKRELHQQ